MLQKMIKGDKPELRDYFLDRWRTSGNLLGGAVDAIDV